MSIVETHIRESSRVSLLLLEQSNTIEKIASSLVDVIKAGGRIYTCGNGGSACDAMHLAEELVARYKRDRPGIAAQHLIDAGTITCWANDASYSDVFSRQIETLATDKDAVVVFSTSGNSENILRALSSANDKGALTIALLGKEGGKAKSLAKMPLVVSSSETAHIQESHIKLVHIICEILETTLFPS